MSRVGWIGVALACAAGFAHAQSVFPSRPVRIIVPFPAGGTADALPRFVADKLTQRWGQPVVVENRVGAGGNIGAEAVAKAEPDGHTLLASPPGPLVINQSLYPKLAFDAQAFVPVTVLGQVPNVLVVHPRFPARTMAELIAYARANPSKVNYASQGSGSTSHLTASMFQFMAGLNLVHIPYKGTAPALTDLLAGQVDLMFDNLGSSLAQVRAGKLRVLAVGGARRAAALADTPTVAEAGLPGFQSVTWFGVVAPPRTPDAIVARISADIAAVLKLPEVAARFADLSVEPVGGTPAETGAFFREETARWRKVISDAAVKLD